jgi:acylpyruvate hydrolase
MSSVPKLYSGTKILAIGKNYAKHKVEMGGTAERLAKPLFFLKPNSSVAHEGAQIIRPVACNDLHHEVELGVVIGSRARHVKAEEAMRYVRGYCLALDMTARDLQAEAKKTGSPWTEAKCYDTFTPISPELNADEIADPHSLELWLEVDGKLKQKGSTGDMMFKIPELIAFTSTVMTLCPGDVILTGTPDGVGPVLPGQVIRCGLNDSKAGGKSIIEMSFPVVEEKLV